MICNRCIFSEPRVCEGGWEKFEESCYLFSLSYGTWNSGKVWLSKQSYLHIRWIIFNDVLKSTKNLYRIISLQCTYRNKFISTRTAAILIAGQVYMKSTSCSLEVDQCTFVKRSWTHFLTVALGFVFTCMCNLKIKISDRDLNNILV